MLTEHEKFIVWAVLQLVTDKQIAEILNTHGTHIKQGDINRIIGLLEDK